MSTYIDKIKVDLIIKNRDIYVKNVVVTILEDETAIRNISEKKL